MPLSRLDNLISSKTGKYLYVSPDDFNATDALSNRGNSPVVPFKSIQRAFLEIARYSYPVSYTHLTLPTKRSV